MEILRENGSYWCSLPDLPEDRYFHTQSGLITCGNQSPQVISIGQTIDINSTRSCLTFSSGQWIKSHSLLFSRVYHSSWISKEGVVLMGSGQGGSANTSEILTNDGNSRPSFPLKANIMYDDTYL